MKASYRGTSMKCLRVLAASLLSFLLLAVPINLAPLTHTSAAQTQPEKKEVKVWVNTKSGVYHCPGSRWYGKTKQGKFMGECQAIKDGNRPAYGKSCGSDCR